jgi:NADPH:quinone reductase-like Zn-dependent oxidoreductase
MGREAMRTVITDQALARRLRIGEAPRPTPAQGEAIVRVVAVSLNRGEVKTALAAPSGWRPGWDYAGVIAEPAADGSTPPAGARVVGMAAFGAWSEFVAAPQPMMARVPDSVSFEDAATLPVAGLTARAAMAKGPPTPGRRVLITGASGGVGVFAIQLAALQGASVTAAIRNPANAAFVRRLGAGQVAIGDDLAGVDGPYDLILESVGGATLGAALSRLAPGGTCVLFGASAGTQTTFDASKFRVGGTDLYGLVMQYEFQHEAPAVGLASMLALMEAGKLEAVIERRAPLADIGQVADDLMQRRFVGKAVLMLADAEA